MNPNETSAKVTLFRILYPERSAAESKDQFLCSEKRQIQLILRQTQDDELLKKNGS